MQKKLLPKFLLFTIFLVSILASSVHAQDNAVQSIGINFRTWKAIDEEGWNNIKYLNNDTSKIYLINQNKQGTGYYLQSITRFTQFGEDGPLTGNNTGLFPDKVRQTYWAQYKWSAAEFRLKLDRTKLYTFKFYGGILGSEDIYSTDYTIGTITKTLNNLNNTDNFIVFSDIRPDENGYVYIKVIATPGFTTGIINGLYIEEHINLSAPKLATIGTRTVEEGGDLDISLSAIDAENDSLTFSVSSPANFITLNDHHDGTATLSINPISDSAGEYDVTVNVADGNGGEDSETFKIIVKVARNDGHPDQAIGINFRTWRTIDEEGWNNFSYMHSDTTRLFLNNQLGEDTDYYFQIINGFSQFGENGAVTGDNSGVFPDKVMQTYWTKGGGGSASFQLKLDKTKLYTLKLHGGVDGIEDIYSTDYTVDGITKSLNNLNNTENEATFHYISPDENGFISVKMNVSYGFTNGIINGILVEEFTRNNIPVLTTIEDQTLYEGDTLTLDLSANDADKDSLQFSLNTTATFVNLINPDDSSAILSIVPEPETAGQYQVAVKVSDGQGGEVTGAFVLSVLANDELLTPEKFTFNSWDETSITLSWKDKSANEEHYILERSNTSVTGYSLIATLPANTDHYTDQNLEPDHIYYYRLKAVGQNEQTSSYSEEIRVKTARTVATDDDLLHDPRYNGNISAIKWKNYDSENERLYTYHYDAANRITAAQYAEGYTENGIWTTSSSQGGFSVNNLTYDHNGNIVSLNRQAAEGTVKTIDALSYAYQGNQLISVLDRAGSQGLADRNMEGDDYAYDANGNLTKDLNQGISLITYNHLNLPERINFENGTYVVYIYDATGTKLAEERYDAEDNLVNEKDYMGAFLYENDTLQFIHHEEGRVVIDPVTEEYEYQYYLRDHLGNTRLTLNTKPDTYTFTASFESEMATDEEMIFTNIENTREVSLAADANDDSGNEVVRVNGDKPMGAGLALPVSPGDMLTMEVYGYYEGGTNYSPQVGLASFITAIAGGFGGIDGGTEAQQAAYDAFDNAIGTMGMMGTSDDNIPAAYLNYILFDKNMNSYQKGYAQITSASNGNPAKLIISDIKVSKPGFVYVYLSNESASQNWVYFDDLEVTLEEFGVVQSDDYYPFGLTFNHYQNITGKENKYLYQGKELLAGTGWYDFHARGYNAALGRFMQLDPKYNGPSGYIGMLNNPLGNVDPNGEEPLSITTAIIIGVAVSAVSYTAAIGFSDGGFDNWDWGDFAKNVGVGVVSSVASWGVGTLFVGIAEVSTTSQLVLDISQATTHAAVQGTIANFTGGNVGTAMLSGFAGSMIGSYGMANNWSNAETIGSAMLMGGASAELSGGEFWRGAAVGGIVAGANHVAHRVGASAEERIQKNKQERQNKGRFFANEGDAYRFMWDNSFDQDGNVIREVAGFLTPKGVLIQPLGNNPRESSNNGFVLMKRKNVIYAVFNGNEYKILGQVHTHPNTQPLGRYEVIPDLAVQKMLGKPIYIIRTTGFYDLNLNYLGSNQSFFDGTNSLINR